jgi:hypothetical protein
LYGFAEGFTFLQCRVYDNHEESAFLRVPVEASPTPS